MCRFYCPAPSLFPGRDNKTFTFLNLFFCCPALFPNTWPALPFKEQSPAMIKAVAHALTILWQSFVRDRPVSQSLTNSTSQIFQPQHNRHLTRPSAYLYASTCTYICIRIRINEHINIYIREHTPTSIYTCVQRAIHIYTYWQTSTHTHIRTCVHAYANACCNAYTYTYAHTLFYLQYIWIYLYEQIIIHIHGYI